MSESEVKRKAVPTVTRLGQDAKKLLDDQGSKSKFISEAILKHDGYCPHCEFEWPKESPPTEPSGTSITAEASDVLARLNKPYKYLSAVIGHELKICPCCGRREE